jgi:hypothetical protein
MFRSRRPGPAGVLLLLAALAMQCTDPSNPAPIGSPAGSLAGSPTATPSTSSPSPGATPMVAALPNRCSEQVPEIGASVAFVAKGRAWAVAPDGSGLTCVFDVADPGPFEWGPRGDRVILEGLAVKGVGIAIDRPGSGIETSSLSWGRPTGKAIVFTPPDGSAVEKAFLLPGQPEDITPLNAGTYSDVVYHPSGLAIGFIATQQSGASEVWISSNNGDSPKRLVFSKKGTVFGPIAFSQDGEQLFYAARLPDGTRRLAAYAMSSGTTEDRLWVGGRDILRMVPPKGPTYPGALLDVGTDCSDQETLFSPLDGEAGTPLVTFPSAPTRAVGWIDPDHALVAEGGCDQPVNLWITGVRSGEQTLLIRGVDRAALRIPEVLPPPPLPEIGIDPGVA